MLLLFQATATQLADSTQIVADKLMEEAIANADGLDKLSLITQQLVDFGIRAGERILIDYLRSRCSGSRNNFFCSPVGFCRCGCRYGVVR